MVPGRNEPLIKQLPEEQNTGTQRKAIRNLETFKDSSFVAIAGAPTNLSTGNSETFPAVKGSDDANAVCFFAAYLMQMILKLAKNAALGFTNMQKIYVGFYGSSQIISHLKLTYHQAAALKEAFNSQNLIGVTYSHAVAYTSEFVPWDVSSRAKSDFLSSNLPSLLLCDAYVRSHCKAVNTDWG